MINKKLSALRLRQERLKRALSQEEVAEVVGTNSMNVSRWETAQTTPMPYYRRKLCDLYQCQSEWLFPFEDKALSTVNTGLHFSSVFHANTTLPGAGEFYGRRGAWIPLVNRLRQQSSTSIIGQRRIGKTWLLEYLRLVVADEVGAGYRVAYLDATLASCPTLDHFTAAILDAFGIPPPKTLLMSENLICLEKAVKASRGKNHVFILCIDEFEGLCGKQGSLLNLLEQLRAMTNLGFCLVVASRRPLISIIAQKLEMIDETSPFFNVFEQITLGPFIRKEAEAFVQDKCRQAGFTEREYAYLLQFGQEQDDQEHWSPLRLQMAGGMMECDRHYSRHDPLYPYLPEEDGYWQQLKDRLEAKYRGVIG